jgi:hypothetical protein
MQHNLYLFSIVTISAIYGYILVKIHIIRINEDLKTLFKFL